LEGINFDRGNNQLDFRDDLDSHTEVEIGFGFPFLHCTDVICSIHAVELIPVVKSQSYAVYNAMRKASMRNVNMG